jgi:hypothetical protein
MRFFLRPSGSALLLFCSFSWLISNVELSLAEYIEYLKNNTSHDKVLKIKGADGESYGIYYVACAQGDSVNLPVATDDISYEISGTNEGGIIVTIKLK